MRDFARLFSSLDETNKTSEKVRIMRDYFTTANPSDSAWAVYFLTGRKMRQIVPTAKLVEWSVELADVSYWMFQECYDAVGDLAETISLLLPPPSAASEGSLTQWVEKFLMPLRVMPDTQQKEALVDAWDRLSDAERLVMTKLITGAFRLGVSQQLVIKALSETSGLDEPTIAHRLMGEWQPTPEFYDSLVHADTEDTAISRPYPFYLAYPLDADPSTLGEISQWVREWKWDGIRSQLVKREHQIFLWSRGEELITERFPEITEAARLLPDGTVIDGEILAWSGDEVMPFNQLQTRITRKTLSKKLLQDVPVALMCYDLLECNARDVRELPMTERRAILEHLIAERAPHSVLRLSPLVEASTWQELETKRANSRAMKVEGLMLKRGSSVYGVGRRRGDWWKWKVNPYTVDAVLIYAQRGSGKRASLYTDYTFGVWQEGKLVPVAKAYSGLTDEEIRQVDAFVRQNTLEKFGPVRTVKPQLVFEIAFEGIQKSTRHKSGVAVRFPRIQRWRHDKPIEEADTLETLSALIDPP